MAQERTLKFSPTPRKVLVGRPASEPDQELLDKGRALVREIAKQIKPAQR
jgi:hypothetical protein